MSEDSGKRGLRAFVDWVENGPDWEDEAGVHEGGAGGHGGENGGHDGENSGHGGEAGVHDGENSGHDGEAGVHGEADTVHASDQAVKRNTKRTMGRRFAEFTEEHALRVFGRVYRAVAQIVDNIQKNCIPVIYYEELTDPKVARAIARESGAQPLLLHSCHNVSKDELAAGATYLSLMEQNAVNLKRGLNGWR